LQVIPGFKGQYRFQKLTMFTPDAAVHRIKPRVRGDRVARLTGATQGELHPSGCISRWRGESSRMLAYRMQTECK
jgi:hypothetical protein